MAVGVFKPNNKGKFETENGKRRFPPEWYAAQAARRKKNKDGTYKEGQFKVSRKLAPELDKLPSAKEKRKMPESWYENQRKKAAERKEAQARGEYTRKVRGKASEYKAKAQTARDKGLKIEKSGARRVELDSYDSVRQAFSQLYKGSKCDISVGGKIETVTIKGSGIYPMTRVGVTSKGTIEIVDTNNLKAGYFY